MFQEVKDISDFVSIKIVDSDLSQISINQNENDIPGKKRNKDERIKTEIHSDLSQEAEVVQIPEDDSATKTSGGPSVK